MKKMEIIKRTHLFRPNEVSVFASNRIAPIYLSVRFWVLFLLIAAVNLTSACAESRRAPEVQKADPPKTLPGEIRVAPDFYSKVYSRGPEYGGIHCVEMPESNIVKELYLVNMDTALNQIPKGQKKKVSVSEFFSGKKYQAQFLKDDSFHARLIQNTKTISLICFVGKLVSFGKSHPFNAQGDYLDWEQVDAETGKWGQLGFIGNNKCDVGGIWAACDMGLSGISRRRADGSVVWARLFAAAKLYDGGQGHPVWGLPDALEVLDSDRKSTWLDDGTAIFTFQYGDKYGPTVRVNMATGALMDKRPDVAMVPLEDWTALKHSLWERWVGKSYPCGFLGSANERECRYKLTELYFYTQQNYLFPMFTAPSHK